MQPVKKHYADFFSPGTFVPEQSRRPIESWDAAAAVELANGIKERHAAKPYGFQFVTCLSAPDVPDGAGGTLKVQEKEIARSGTHFLGGSLMRYEEVPDTKENRILRSNMACNNMPVVIENSNSWRFTGAFKEQDCIVDADGSIKRRGNDADLMQYREAFAKTRSLIA